MEPALKQRLLGAAVIVALAVIIIPFLLDGSGTEPVSEVPLPPEPATEQNGPLVTDDHVPQPAYPPQSQAVDQYTAPQPAQTPDSAMEPAMPAETAPSAPTPETAPAPAPAPEPEPEPAPEPRPTPAPSAQSDAPKAAATLHAWVVQVGSFSEQDKAMALRDRLRKAQFKAFVERFQTSAGKSMYRVRVGPVPERAEAESLQQKLEAQEKLKGFVTEHP